MSSVVPHVRFGIVGGSVVIAASLCVGSVVAASNPPTLYACYDAYGNVRMTDIAQCKLPGGGRLVSWGTAAVPGPTGTTGPTGPHGPTGATGPAGSVTGANTFDVVADPVVLPAYSGLVYLEAYCPAGAVATGGGWEVGGGSVWIAEEHGLGSMDAWSIRVGNYDSIPHEVRVHVECLSFP